MIAHAQKAVATLNGARHFGKVLSVKQCLPGWGDSPAVGMFCDSIVRINLPAPGHTAYIGLPNFQKAQAAIETLRGIPVEYGTVNAELHDGLPQVGEFTVKVTGLPDDKLEKVKQSIPQAYRHLFHGINYKKVPNWGEEAYKLTGGVGVDHVIEVGGPGTLEQAFAACKKGAHISNIGFVAGGDQPNMALNVLAKRAIYRGIFVGSRELFQDLNAVLEAHPDIHPLIDRVFDFKDAVKAYEYQWSAAHVGKVIIRVN